MRKDEQMSASIAIQVLPEASDSEQVCQRVDKVIEYIQSTGLRYEVGPFETAIEGDNLDQLMEVARECLYIAAKAGADKVSAYIKVIYRPDGKILTIDQKIRKYR